MRPVRKFEVFYYAELSRTNCRRKGVVLFKQEHSSCFQDLAFQTEAPERLDKLYLVNSYHQKNFWNKMVFHQQMLV